MEYQKCSSPGRVLVWLLDGRQLWLVAISCSQLAISRCSAYNCCGCFSKRGGRRLCWPYFLCQQEDPLLGYWRMFASSVSTSRHWECNIVAWTRCLWLCCSFFGLTGPCVHPLGAEPWHDAWCDTIISGNKEVKHFLQNTCLTFFTKQLSEYRLGK